MKAGAILETVLYAEDLAAARTFYGDVLGLELYWEIAGRFVFFRCPGHQMLLIFDPRQTQAQAGDGPPPHGAFGSGHVCFRAEAAEIAAWRDHLASRGVAVERVIDWPDGGRSLYVRDPAGNSVEFAEPRIWDLAGSRSLAPGSRLVVATHNAGKVREIADLLAGLDVVAVSAAELGLPEPDETADSFAGNALLKAAQAAERSGLPALADDSGLCVDALAGAPGIHSARWAGPGRDFARAMETVEERLAAASGPRTAHFICALCLAWPDGDARIHVGRVDGTLVWPPRGSRGFGYDPMFLPEGETETFGEMQPDRKHAMSHRARAFRKLVDDLT